MKVDISVLGSGSAGNATVIRAGADVILVDAGFSGKKLAERLDQVGVKAEEISAILVTHEHDDHVQGLRVFAKRHGGIPAYANALTAERLGLMKKAPAAMKVFSNGALFTVGPFEVEAFSISHDAVDPVGFSIRVNGVRVALCTDLGVVGKMVPVKLQDHDLVVLESNHCPELLRASTRPLSLQQRILSRRGHLSNQMAADLVPQIASSRTKHFIMAHLSEDCNDRALVGRTMDRALAAIRRTDVNVVIAAQHQVCEPITLG